MRLYGPPPLICCNNMHTNVWASSHLLGQPELTDTLLAQVGDLTRFYQALLAGGGDVARASTLEGSSFPSRIVQLFVF
jgi:hypothetical protein